MSKLLHVIRIILLTILILLNIYFIFSRAIHAVVNDWGGYPIYLLFLIIIVFVTVKDTIKKSGINHNNTYQVISILIFFIMNVILFRTLFDSHLFFNNLYIISEYQKYSKMVGSYSEPFVEFSKYYLKQNMIYFNVMFVLLFIYRRINLSIKND